MKLNGSHFSHVPTHLLIAAYQKAVRACRALEDNNGFGVRSMLLPLKGILQTCVGYQEAASRTTVGVACPIGPDVQTGIITKDNGEEFCCGCGVPLSHVGTISCSGCPMRGDNPRTKSCVRKCDPENLLIYMGDEKPVDLTDPSALEWFAAQEPVKQEYLVKLYAGVRRYKAGESYIVEAVDPKTAVDDDAMEKHLMKRLMVNEDIDKFTCSSMSVRIPDSIVARIKADAIKEYLKENQ